MFRVYYPLITILLTLITACKSIAAKDTIVTQDDHFKMVIEDYYNNNKEYIEAYDMFFLNDRTISSKGYYLYNILPVNNEYYYSVGVRTSFLPIGYIEYKGKTFFLEQDENKEEKEPSPELLQYLHSKKQLDSTQIKIALGLLDEEDAPLRIDIFDDSLEGVDYIFCKEKPYKIRKRVKDAVYREPDDKKFNVCD